MQPGWEEGPLAWMLKSVIFYHLERGEAVTAQFERWKMSVTYCSDLQRHITQRLQDSFLDTPPAQLQTENFEKPAYCAQSPSSHLLLPKSCQLVTEPNVSTSQNI